MAAGQGFKTFATGDVLSASDVNGYLMQGVLVFADATERNAEITSPQEGQFAYLKDTNVTTYYTGSAWANLDTTGMTNPMTTTGDTIYSSSGSTPARLGIGSTGQVLTVSGGVPSWATPASGSTYVGCSVSNSATQSINNATETAITYDTEQWDTDAIHSTSSNTSRFTVPSGKGGKWRLSSSINGTGSGVIWEFYIYKNGSYFITGFPQFTMTGNSRGTGMAVCNFELDLVATDYIQIYTSQTSGGTENIRMQYGRVFFSYIGA